MRTLDHYMVRDVREAVAHAKRVYPNAHLGDHTPREDMHSAFVLIRSRIKGGLPLGSAVQELISDCYRYEDM